MAVSTVRFPVVKMRNTDVKLYDFSVMGQQFDDEFWSGVMALGASGPVSAAAFLLVHFLSFFSLFFFFDKKI